MTHQDGLKGMKLIGIDGCRAGWILASSDESLSGLRFERTCELWEVFGGTMRGKPRLVIDVPIGFSSSGSCLCDVAARRLLRAPRNSSSVSSAPPG